MAELDFPARVRARTFPVVVAPWSIGRVIRIQGCPATYVMNSGRDDADGHEEAPSLRLATLGSYRFRVAIDAGSRSLRVFARQPVTGQPRPRMVVRANPEIGLLTDQSMSAPSGSGWVEIGPISFTASQHGGVWVEFWNPAARWPCWFDAFSLE